MLALDNLKHKVFLGVHHHAPGHLLKSSSILQPITSNDSSMSSSSWIIVHQIIVIMIRSVDDDQTAESSRWNQTNNSNKLNVESNFCVMDVELLKQVSRFFVVLCSVHFWLVVVPSKNWSSDFNPREVERHDSSNYLMEKNKTETEMQQKLKKQKRRRYRSFTSRSRDKRWVEGGGEISWIKKKK